MKRIVWVILAASPLAAQPLELSLRRAVELAGTPEGNINVTLAAAAVKQAESRSAQARASLLPDLSGYFVARSQTVNLAAMGLRLVSPIPGITFPTLVGPFAVLDARVNATQTVFDYAAIRRYQASKVGVTASKSDSARVSDAVAAQVARAYMAALKGDADVEAAEANVELAEAVLKQAEDQKAAGTGTGIEITRARVQLANDRQRLLQSQNTRRASH